jgi:uncharacterized protein YhhL (DUF1145 family)
MAATPQELSTGSTARAFRHAVYAASMLLAPILLIPGTLFNPAVGGIAAGAKNIAANVAADPTTNQLHLGIYVLETFLLPLGILGLAGLALRRSPWLATIGGGLGLIGWLPWSALTAQDDLTFRMAQLGGDAQLVDLWNRFTTDWAMGVLTLIYVLCHLAAFVVLGVALGRARVIPWWAGWALILTSPITIIAFPAHQPGLLYLVAALWVAGSLPAALAVWRNREAATT